MSPKELEEEIKNQKIKQQDMTELNGDGNRERGRYGEDESNQEDKQDRKKST
tara:strand:+ start:66 stop:221 length:156 start_codon:yes stop_codon:yes gene_type:complete